MTNENGIKCYKSVSCIISVLVIAFIFGAIIIDLAISKPALREDISNINTELTQINQQIDKIDSLQLETNKRFIEILDRQAEEKLQK